MQLGWSVVKCILFYTQNQTVSASKIESGCSPCFNAVSDVLCTGARMKCSDRKMQCGFCHRGDEVENICDKLWFVNNVKTQCAAHWKCMVCINTVIVIN